MKLVNRGFIRVKAKQGFIDWANKVEPEFELDEEVEGNVYLIEEDFFDVEPVIEANFKKIFETELYMISEEEESFPVINIETFLDWFEIEIGNTVFDTLKSDIKAL